MKLIYVANTLFFGLTLAGSALAGSSLHTGGDVYQIPPTEVSEINLVNHYSQLFDQLDANHDGLLQTAELQHALADLQASLTSGGYQRSPTTFNTSKRTLSKKEFIALQNVGTDKKVKKMAESQDPQQWLSNQVGHG